jgi:hypothetical protein
MSRFRAVGMITLIGVELKLMAAFGALTGAV